MFSRVHLLSTVSDLGVYIFEILISQLVALRVNKLLYFRELFLFHDSVFLEVFLLLHVVDFLLKLHLSLPV